MTGRGPEGKVQDRLMKELRKIPDSDWTKPTITNKVGCADILGDIQGIAVYIEVKKDEKTKPEPIQLYRINKALQRGAVSFSTFEWEDCSVKLYEQFKAKGILIPIPAR